MQASRFFRAARAAATISQEGLWYGALTSIALAVGILHLVIIETPRAFVFDEFFCVPQALRIVGGLTLQGNHPPLAMLLIAASIVLLGDRPYAWRIPSVLLGLASVWAIFAIVKAGTKKNSLALMSSALYAADVLTFVQSSLATLDIFFVFFMLLGFYFFLKGKLTLATVAVAMSTFCKLTGIMGFIVIVMAEMFSKVSPRKILIHFTVYISSLTILFLGAFPIWASGSLTPLEFLRSIALGNIQNIISNASQFNPSIVSMPWEWVINPRPVAYYCAALPGALQITYVGMGNPLSGSSRCPRSRSLLGSIVDVGIGFLRSFWFGLRQPTSLGLR